MSAHRASPPVVKSGCIRRAMHDEVNDLPPVVDGNRRCRAIPDQSGRAPTALRAIIADELMIKPLILAVDDDPQVLRAIGRDLVTKYGRDFRVVRAQSGAEGLDVLRHERESAQPVAMILSDQRMPQPRRGAVSRRSQDACSVGEARAAHRLRRHRRRDRRHQHLAGRLLPAEALGSAAGSCSTRSSTTCSTTGAPTTVRAGAASASSAAAGCRRCTRSRSSSPAITCRTSSSTSNRPTSTAREARELTAGAAALPLVIMPDGARLTDPTVDDVARAIGAQDRGDRRPPTTSRSSAPVRPAWRPPSTPRRKA